MKIKSERCGICMTWRYLPAHKHCHNCGAYHLVVGAKHTYVNCHGVEMVRGIPMDLQRTIERLEAQ